MIAGVCGFNSHSTASVVCRRLTCSLDELSVSLSELLVMSSESSPLPSDEVLCLVAPPPEIRVDRRGFEPLGIGCDNASPPV